MQDLADRVSEQAKLLFHHLPEGEIRDDEPLYFTVSGGELTVWVRRTNWNYTLHKGVVYRYQAHVGAVDVTAYQHGQEVDRRTVALDDKKPWLN